MELKFNTKIEIGDSNLQIQGTINPKDIKALVEAIRSLDDTINNNDSDRTREELEAFVSNYQKLDELKKARRIEELKKMRKHHKAQH